MQAHCWWIPLEESKHRLTFTCLLLGNYFKHLSAKFMPCCHELSFSKWHVSMISKAFRWEQSYQNTYNHINASVYMWSIELMTDCAEKNTIISLTEQFSSRTQNKHPDKTGYKARLVRFLKASVVTVLWSPRLCLNVHDGKAALSRQLLGRHSEAT